MKIIAVTNIKGGVGKTTSAVNLAFLCAASGYTSVLWDLDPQGAATYALRCEAGEGASAKKLVAGKRELPELLVQTGYDGLDLIPAHFSYRNFDVHLSNRKRPTERLLMMSASLREKYAGKQCRAGKAGSLEVSNACPGKRECLPSVSGA